MSAEDVSSEVSRASNQTLTIPVSLAQWLGGGFLVAALSGGSAYVGTSTASSPEVVTLQIEQLDAKVVELQVQLRALEQVIRERASTYVTRIEHGEALRELERRVERMERRQDRD